MEIDKFLILSDMVKKTTGSMESIEKSLVIVNLLEYNALYSNSNLKSSFL